MTVNPTEMNSELTIHPRNVHIRFAVVAAPEDTAVLTTSCSFLRMNRLSVTPYLPVVTQILDYNYL